MAAEPATVAREPTAGGPAAHRLRAGAIAAGLAAAIAGLAAAQGGYFPTSWNWAALGFVWVAGLALVLSARVELSRAEVVFLGLLAALTVWTAISLAWTSSIPQSVDEVQRTLVYLAAAAAFLLVARRSLADSLLGAVLAALAGVCAYAIATRLFPNQLSGDVFGGYRLSTPIGYWNGLGLIAAIASLLAVGFAASERRLVARILAGASLPLLLVTLYFTYSRGAWVALATGLALTIALSPHRLRLVTALAVLAPGPALTVWLASRSGALTHAGSTLAAASHQGHRLAWMLLGLTALSALLVVLLHAAERELAIGVRPRRAFAGALIATLLAAIVTGLVAGGGPVQIARHAYDRFTASPRSSHNLNGRLFDLSSNGRTELWHAAWHEFRGDPALGTGGGTFEPYWYRHRPSGQNVRDAHNLYVQTLAELGIPGLVLLLGMLAVPYAGARARRHPLVPAALGAYTALLVHAVYDWDWQLPAVTLAGLFCGLAALVAARTDSPVNVSGRGRLVLLCAVVVCGAFAFVALVGNMAASRSQSALDAKHYAKAASRARTAADWAPWAARPWYLLGKAQAALGQQADAVKSLRTAVRNDPTDFRNWLELSVVAAGQERLHALAEAFRLNPRL